MYELTTLGTAARLCLAGPNETTPGSTRVGIPPKRFALLVYLALQNGVLCRRDHLLALFWPESNAARARNALSKTLGRIRADLGDGVVVNAGAHEIGIAPGALVSDVDRFRQAMRAGEWARAHAVYDGDFLGGFHLPDSPGFEQWAASVRDELRREAVLATLNWAGEQQARREWEAAAATLRRTLRMVPTDESVARCLITVLGEAGDPAAAMVAYRELAATLRRDVDAEPSEATRALMESLRRAPAIRSLAVLPWANLTGSVESDHVTGGFTDLLITELALAYPGRVIARQSSLQLKGSDLPLRRIGAILRVDAVVEGSIARFGERLTLTAQLLRVEPEEHLWADRVHAAIDELPAVATRFAAAVGHTIRQEASGSPDGSGQRQTGGVSGAVNDAVPTSHDAVRPPAKSQGMPAPAYEAYLRARHFASALPGLEKAVACYRECLDIAPHHAAPWAGLASTFAVLTLLAVRSPAELFPPFRRAAEHAIALDPNLGEAHTSLGLYRLLADRDWRGAEDSLRRGAGLAAGHAEPHTHLALYLAAMGRFDEAAAACARALDCDPIGPATRFTIAWCLYKSGRHEDSNATLGDVLDLHPQLVLATTYRALNFALLDRPAEAAREALQAMAAAPELPEIVALGIAALGRAGHTDAAAQPLDWLLEAEQLRYVDPWALGVAFAGLGRTDEALHWFRRMYDERSPSAFCIRHDPLIDGLRQDPRFREIERRLAFPDIRMSGHR